MGGGQIHGQVVLKKPFLNSIDGRICTPGDGRGSDPRENSVEKISIHVRNSINTADGFGPWEVDLDPADGKGSNPWAN